MKRLLIAAHQARYNSDGGLESLSKLIERLSESYRIIIITNGNSAFTLRWKESGCKIYAAPTIEVTNTSRFLASVKWIFTCIRAIQQERPGVSIANDGLAFRMLLKASCLFRISTVLTIRDTKPKGEEYGVKWRKLLNSASKVVVLSTEMREILSDGTNVHPSKVTVINSIVDCETFAPVTPQKKTEIRQNLGLNDQKFCVGVVGAFRKKKNQLRILNEVAPRLVKENPNIEFFFLGDFNTQLPYEKKCLSAIHKHQLHDYVRVPGHQKEMHRWYQGLDCVLIATENEGLARAMIEALACGTPVISTRVCSASEFLEKTSAGIVIEEENSELILEAILKLSNDTLLRNRMSETAAQVAKSRFNADKITAEWQHLIEEMLVV